MLNNLLQMNLSEAISNQIKLGILTIVRQEVTNVTSLILQKNFNWTVCVIFLFL